MRLAIQNRPSFHLSYCSNSSSHFCPTQTDGYVPATKRFIMMLAEANNTYVDPKYGPKNAGPSMTLRASYEGFVAGIPAGSTNLGIQTTDTRTGVVTYYGCRDQLL